MDQFEFSSWGWVLGVIVFSMALRIPVVHPNRRDFDFYGHLHFAQRLREEKAGPFGPVRLNLVGVRPYFAPMFWSWCLRLVPYPFVKKYQNYFNPLIEALFAGLFFLLLLKLGFSHFVAVLSIGLFLFTPATFTRMSNGPRLSSFTPRLSSEVLTGIFVLLEILRDQEQGQVIFLLQVLTGVLIVMTSKFGPQAMIFISGLYWILSGSPYPFLAALAAFLLTLLIFRKNAISAWSTQIGHLAEVLRRTRNRKLIVTSRVSLFELIRTAGLGTKIRLGVSKNLMGQLLLTFPVVVVALASEFGKDGSPFQSVPSQLALAAFITFVLTGLPFGRFLGHAERYLLHGLPAFVILIAANLSHGFAISWLYSLLAFGFLYFLMEIVVNTVRASGWARANGQESQSILEVLRTLPRATASCFPLHAGPGAWALAAETPHGIVFDLVNPRLSSLDGRVFEEYPRLNIGFIVSSPGVLGELYVVTNRATWQSEVEPILGGKADDMILHEENDLLIFALGRDSVRP